MANYLGDKRVIVGSVAVGPYRNLGNQLIERATLKLLGLSRSTPTFSVFEPISPELAHHINQHDLVVFTGCTILQDDPGHQRCFNKGFNGISVRMLCVGASFCCELRAEPSLRIARLFDIPLAVRDPWTSDYLARSNVPHAFIGCPTLLDSDHNHDWRSLQNGRTLVSSTPRLDKTLVDGLDDPDICYVKHEPDSPGTDIRSDELFHDVKRVITGRLHLALPAIARGIPVKFYGPDFWCGEPSRRFAGPSRFSLLRYLGVSLNGEAGAYPQEQIRTLRASYSEWLELSLA